tara:strand:- start:1873 stop:3048 length:1176 start_codon:yes stop_codon:yes gene_type:complete
MGNLVNALNELKTNIFGSSSTGKTTPILRQSAIEMKDTSPTSKAGVDPLAFSSISYPKDVTNDLQNGHYMLFYVNVANRTKYKYKNPEGDEVGGKGKFTELNEDGSVVFKDIDGSGEGSFDRTKTFNALTGKYNNNSDIEKLHKNKQRRQSGLASVLPTTTRITDSVAIYLPPNVQDNTSAVYSDSQTGMVGFTLLGGLKFSNEFKRGDYEAAAATLIDGFGGLIAEGAKKATAAFVEGLTETEGAAGLFNKTFGQADNPFMEVLFDKVNMRTFTYNFTFAPRNKDERDDVQKIIHLFRFHMMPELQGSHARFLTLPSEFDIHYMYQSQDGQASENDYYNKIATCVLQDCTVDYTPGGVKSFEDGSPTQIKMSLTFKETQLLTKELVAQGF